VDQRSQADRRSGTGDSKPKPRFEVSFSCDPEARFDGLHRWKFALSPEQAPPTLLRRRAASEYLREHWAVRASEQTLAKYAVQGCGPAFQRYLRDVVYTAQNLDEWARTRLSKPLRSTSQTDTSTPRTEEARSPREEVAAAFEEARKSNIRSLGNAKSRLSRDYLWRLTKKQLIELLLACPCGAGPP
jgi:hypothetical protein